MTVKDRLIERLEMLATPLPKGTVSALAKDLGVSRQVVSYLLKHRLKVPLDKSVLRCQDCGGRLHSSKYTRCRSCHITASRITMTCDYCGTTWQEPRSVQPGRVLQGSKYRYCARVCFYLHRSIQYAKDPEAVKALIADIKLLHKAYGKIPYGGVTQLAKKHRISPAKLAKIQKWLRLATSSRRR